MKQFSGRRYVNLESYKSNGEPELTPVQSVEDGGVLYLRTDPRAGKIGRIRSNPQVRVVPCDRKGRTSGTWVEGEANFIAGAEYERVMKLLKSESGVLGGALVDLMALLKGQRLTVLISVRPKQPARMPPDSK